ncbi:cell division protein SepF [Negativibacillus massiliensis]|jgi:cell division inhibitor SepF|uniref:cell division protein SepF n=1 Tax=Negativibacillus massiliensis TaxID=1871035 RepID=UPI000339A396|nr:cell division protein SepF [Negativibacillus massiliensis]MBS5138078.1 cell division protein SepF [Clostridium sp.]MCI6348280.1 cell division protein SepF [Negativibacillus massiliensis]MDY4047079.1 cell division protein SepF [Negativibacillus massiliensis]CDA78613.1 cell division protein sepF [Clostridium sp. CAG:242]
MALRDTLRNLIGIPENDYDSEYDDDMQAGNVEQEEEEQMPSPSLSSDRKHNKVVNIHATTQLAVVLVKPERYEDAASIADHLNAKKTVVLNLEQTSKDVSRRLIDFLCGVAYANNGQMKRVANNTYIITPYNVDIMGDLLDELENNGVIF